MTNMVPKSVTPVREATAGSIFVHLRSNDDLIVCHRSQTRYRVLAPADTYRYRNGGPRVLRE